MSATRSIEAAKARIAAELHATVEELARRRKQDRERERGDELLGVLKDMQKDLRRLSEAVSGHLEPL